MTAMTDIIPQLSLPSCILCSSITGNTRSLADALAGAIAGIIAAGVLICAVAFVEKSQIPELGNYLSPVETGLVCALVVAVGAGLCALAALIATNRYLHKDYDELFT